MPYSIAIGGPPGTGKSWFASSIADIVGAEHTLALCAKPREAASYGYTSRGIKTELFTDLGWRPSLKMFETGGFMAFMRRLWDLMSDDQYDAVLVDPFTDVAELVAHELLKKDNASTARETNDTMGFYGELRPKLIEVTRCITQLQFAARPKHVIVTVHMQPIKEEAPAKKGEVAKKAQDKKAQGWMFEGGALPAFEGSAKYLWASEFDAFLLSDVVTRFDSKLKPPRSVTEYVIQVRPDNERHATIAFLPALA